MVPTTACLFKNAMPMVNIKKTVPAPSTYQRNCNSPVIKSLEVRDPPTTIKKIGNVQLIEVATKAVPNRKKPIKYEPKKLADVKRVVNKWLYLEDPYIIDVILSVYVANRIEGDPVWMMLIGPPSSAKTELLRSFDGHENAYFLSSLTPSTLVSGMPQKKNMEDPSLLLKLDDKLLVVKDFTSILSMRSESQQEIIAQLREIYDGKYSKVSLQAGR